jgi:hypothetical protein
MFGKVVRWEGFLFSRVAHTGMIGGLDGKIWHIGDTRRG